MEFIRLKRSIIIIFFLARKFIVVKNRDPRRRVVSI